MQNSKKIAILGGGEEELNILSEFHRTPGVSVIAVYDRDPRAVAMEIAEIIGVPTFSDNSFLSTFAKADYIIVTQKRKRFEQEILLLQTESKRIINPSEAVNYLASPTEEEKGEPHHPWPVHLEEALQYIERITDRERLLKWLLEISVRAVDASSGSIMLFSEQARELYIGYASGLSSEVVEKTRQRLGEGIAGVVAETQKSRLITQIVDAPLYREGRERETIESAISTPLIYDEQLIGVLNVSTNMGDKKLSETEIETIEMLSSKITPILHQHLKIDAHEIREIEYQIRNYLELLFHREVGFHDKFTFLCTFLVDKLDADTVTIYTATDEGDWLILGGSDQQVAIGTPNSRIHCIKGSLARAYLNQEEVLMTEASRDIDLKLKTESGSLTSVYLPLVHNQPLGVLVIEFSNLSVLDRFFKFKDSLRFQVGFFTFSQLRELRQSRKMDSLEKLSALTPAMMELDGLTSKIKRLPALISSLVKASIGCFHYEGPGGQETSYYNLPQSDPERKTRIEYDNEIVKLVLSSGEPIIKSFLSIDIDMSEEPSMYRSVIAYPLFKTDDETAVYIGYDKIPDTPLDSSIFGEHEADLLRKIGAILLPLFGKKKTEQHKGESLTFDDLLRSNQKILIEHISDEIKRADRYHHGFILTLFKLNGLKNFLKKDYQTGLALVNDLSLGIRRQVRRSDYFSWIESDIFAVLSLESFQRIGQFEGRLMEHIKKSLIVKGVFDPELFYPSTSCILYPGSSETAVDLINEAKEKL